MLTVITIKEFIVTVTAQVNTAGLAHTCTQKDRPNVLRGRKVESLTNKRAER